MSVFAWNDKYSLNIAEIDAQHRKLIGLVARLNEAMRQGKGKQTLGQVLEELVRYTQTHFAAEERLMKTHGYPEYEEHKTKHTKMTQKVLDIQKEYQAGKVTLTLEVMKFLENWIDRHILGTDKKYAPFLADKGVR